jgi:transcriptional regulator with XRE-family HTH domain
MQAVKEGCLGERLRERRKAIRLTQKELEERSGIPQNTISRIELGQNPDTSTRTLTKLALALNVRPDYLLGFTDEPELSVNIPE